MGTNLKNKLVLITAGPTWVKIDDVRVISNTATGLTGTLLANKFSRLGAKVTLLLGPTETGKTDKRVKILKFRYFDELDSLLRKELASKKYDLAIHSAAVSDYKPVVSYEGKIQSGIKKLVLKLAPTPKIIEVFKKKSPLTLLVAFKFEPNASRLKLNNEARRLIINTKADIIIANTVQKGTYTAYLIKKNNLFGPFFTKNNLAENLINKIKKENLL